MQLASSSGSCDKLFKDTEGFGAHHQIHQRAALQKTSNRDIRVEDDRPHQCTFDACGKAFATRKGLSVHQNRIHTRVGSKPFKCNVDGCDKLYSSQGALSSHQASKHLADRTHTFKCLKKGCGETYASEIGLTIHTRKVHSQGENPSSESYKCSVEGCQYIGSLPNHLKRHQSTAHGIWRCSAHSCEFECDNHEQLSAHREVYAIIISYE